jgi:hypothetical protein
VVEGELEFTVGGYTLSGRGTEHSRMVVVITLAGLERFRASR